MGGFAAPIAKRVVETVGKDVVESVSHAFQSGEYSLMQKGGASALLGKMLRTWQQVGESDAAKVVTPLAADLEHVAKDPVRSAEFYNQHVNGQLSSDRQTAIAGIKSNKAMLDLHNRFKQAGLKVAPLVDKGYFPEYYPHEMFEKGTPQYEQAVGELSQKKQISRVQAEHLLDKDNPNPRSVSLTGRYHSIETTRKFDLPDLARKDPAVVMEHLIKGTKRFHEATMFGQDGEKAKFLFDQIEKESGRAHRRFAEELYSHFMGHAPQPGKVERAVNSWEIASHLGQAVLSHPAKTVESMFVGGIQPFVKALSELATASGREEFTHFAQLSGAVLHDTVADLRRLVGEEHEGMGGKVLRATQFQKVINFQEMLHVNVGKHAVQQEFADYAKSQSSKSAIRLASLGVDAKAALERGGLTQDEILKAGYKMSHIVLGGRTVLDLPPVWKTSAAGRLITKFKPFFFLQTKFIKDQIIKPALQGDMRPLIYASIVYPLVGEVVADVKTLARGKNIEDRPKELLDRALDNIATVGGFGMAADVMNTMWTGSAATTMEFLGGPVLSDAAELIDFPSASRTTKERQILQRIPTVGPALARHFAPPKHPYKSPLQRGAATKLLNEVKKAL